MSFWCKLGWHAWHYLRCPTEVRFTPSHRMRYSYNEWPSFGSLNGELWKTDRICRLCEKPVFEFDAEVARLEKLAEERRLHAIALLEEDARLSAKAKVRKEMQRKAGE